MSVLAAYDVTQTTKICTIIERLTSLKTLPYHRPHAPRFELYKALARLEPPLVGVQLEYDTSELCERYSVMSRHVALWYTIEAGQQNSVNLNALSMLAPSLFIFPPRPPRRGLLYYGTYRQRRVARIAEWADVWFLNTAQSTVLQKVKLAKSKYPLNVEIAPPTPGRHVYLDDEGSPPMFAALRLYEAAINNFELVVHVETPFLHPADGVGLAVVHSREEALRTRKVTTFDVQALQRYAENVLNELVRKHEAHKRTYTPPAWWGTFREYVAWVAAHEHALTQEQLIRLCVYDPSRLAPARDGWEYDGETLVQKRYARLIVAQSKTKQQQHTLL